MRLPQTLLLLLAWTAAAASVAVPPAPAQGTFVLMNERNHPELRWMELRTAHFRIFYHDPLESWAREAVSILERYDAPLRERLGVEPGGPPTRVYLSDQDQIANGAAVGDYFYVWIPSHPISRWYAGDRPWLEEVLIHEYTHVLITRASWTWIGNLAFLVGAYPPRWVHEGVAQWTAERWSVTRGDQTLGAAVMDGSIERTPPGVPGEGALLYSRGHARIRWIAAMAGDSTIARLLEPHGSLGLYSYPAAERRALGTKRAGRSSEDFRRDMIAFYGARYEAGEDPDSLGRLADAPLAYPQRFVELGSDVGSDVGSEADSTADSTGDSTASGPAPGFWTGQARRGAPESSLFLAGKDGARRVVAGSVSGSPVPLPGGGALLPRLHRADHGAIVEDLGLWEPREGFRFLTHGERIGEAAWLSGTGAAADSPLVVLFDRPLETVLARGRLAPDRRAIDVRPILSWPRGHNLHGLASSPDGSRLAVSIAEPDGSRGLWGIRLRPDGAGRLPLLRHRVDVAEERSASWVDEETLAWTSYEGGIANVRTARWPEGADSLTGARLRTKTGIGADLAGVRDDSLLVVDRSTRLRFPVRAAAAATRRGTGGDLPRDPYPFPSGRAVAPLPAESVSVAATAEGPFPYRALREVRPWFLLPLLGPQAGSLGFGGLAIASEPLLRHSIGAYVYGSPESYRDPDRAAAYLTGRFGPWLAAYHHSTILPRRVLRGGILWERREQTGIGVLAPLQSSADPNRGGWIALAVDADSRWPRFDAAALRTPLGAPRAWSGVRASIEAGTVHQPPPARGNVATGISVRVDGSLAALEHQERFLRAAARFFHAAPLPFAPSRLYLEGSFNGVSGPGRSGGLPPQEYLGLDRYPSYDAGVPGLDLDGTVFLRGWPRERAARAVLYGDLEIRMPVLPDFGIRGPGFAIGAGTLAPFLEAAHPWGGYSAPLSEERTRVAAGFEARLGARLGPLPLVASAAWGRPLGREHPDGFVTWRVSAGPPVRAPLSPARLARALLGGRLIEELPRDESLPR